ncbi:MAG: HEAT repeat domain-containing protein, partial [Isosphaeraceae bacterium]
NRMCHERRSVTPVIVKALAEQLSAADVDERRHIVQTLAGLGAASAAAVEPLAAALDDDDPQVRGWAATALAGLGDPRSISVLIERLRSERTLMARSLDRLGAEARALVPALIDVLGDSPAKDDIGNPRIQAALALGRIGPDARPAIPALIELMDREPDTQPYVAQAIGQIGGPVARAAIPRWEGLLRSSDESCRIRAAQALWRLDGQAGPVLDVLDEQLHPKSRLRALAAEVLGEMGEAARGEVPALLACLEDRSFHRRWVHVEAAIALWRITHQPELTRPVLMKIFGDPAASAALARRAAEGLGEMGAEAVEALPILREAAALDVRPFGQMFSYSSDFVIEDDALLAAVTEAIRRIEGDLGRAKRSTGQAPR